MGTGNPENWETSKTHCDIDVLSQNVEKHTGGEVLHCSGRGVGWDTRWDPEIHKQKMKTTPENEATGHPKVSPRSSKIVKNLEKSCIQKRPSEKHSKKCRKRPPPTLKNDGFALEGLQKSQKPGVAERYQKYLPNPSQFYLKSQKIVAWTPPKHSLKNT